MHWRYNQGFIIISNDQFTLDLNRFEGRQIMMQTQLTVYNEGDLLFNFSVEVGRGASIFSSVACIHIFNSQVIIGFPQPRITHRN